MIPLQQGGNATLSDGVVRVRLTWSPERIGGLEVDASAFLLAATGKVRSDDDMVFYGQPSAAQDAVRIEGKEFVVNLAQLPGAIERIAFAITIHEADGKGVSFAAADATLEIPGAVRYAAITAGMVETALIMGEIYRRNGAWKIRAIGQGFAGGLKPLAEHFGVVVENAPAPAPPAPEPAHSVSLQKRLVSLEKTDPELVSLVKKVQVSLTKKKLVSDRAKVGLALDISGSMSTLYGSGKIDRLLQRVMALGLRFDDDGDIDVFLFGAKAHRYGTLNAQSYRGFVPAMRRTHGLEGHTYYGKVMAEIRDHYRSQPDWGTVPVYCMFVTDGGTEDEALSERQIIDASREPIFWQFMAIDEERRGIFGSRKSAPSGKFEFLERLDTLRGRTIDNAGFFSVNDPSAPTDEELFDLLMKEYPDWLKEASARGIVRR